MADKYFVGDIDTYWHKGGNWALTSGGAGGAGAPTEDDNVFLDANSPNCLVGFSTEAYVAVCNDLDMTGYTGTFELYWDVFDSTASAIIISGQFDAPGTISNPITITSDAVQSFILEGTLGTVTYVNATNINSAGGRRIYDSNGTLTNCFYWRTTLPTTYHITNVTELQNMNNDTDGDYILDNDIDLTAVSWTQIGPSIDKFTGTLDGQGFTIRNLSMTAASVGLFDSINADAVIHDLNLDSFNLTGSGGALCSFIETGGTVFNVNATNLTIGSSSASEVGGLFGGVFSSATSPVGIRNCTVDGVSVTGNNLAGGFAGDVIVNADADEIQFDGCFVTNLTLIAAGDSADSIGGFFGNGSGTLSNCNVQGTITDTGVTTGIEAIGGFFGAANLVNFSECYSDVNITLDNTTSFKDLIGGFGGDGVGFTFEASKCYALGNIVTSNSDSSFAIGAFIGSLNLDTDDTLADCYSHVTLDVSVGTGDYEGIGGFIGYGDTITGVLRNSYGSGSISCPSKAALSIGGFMGTADSCDAMTLENVFSVGVITGTGVVGGFIGEVIDPSIVPSNCAWYTGQTTNAIGKKSGVAVDTLDSLGWGTDEPSRGSFKRTTDHVVFAQGT
jgi:hypothetical protein